MLHKGYLASATVLGFHTNDTNDDVVMNKVGLKYM